jgi:hypothetical protein
MRTMPTGRGDSGEQERALRAAVNAALSDVPDEGRPHPPTSTDDWLRIGLVLGLRDPGRARHLLEMLDAGRFDRAAHAADVPHDRLSFEAVPFRSTALARAAAVPSSTHGGPASEPAFAWAAVLSPAEILGLGQVVQEMLAQGAPRDISRGYGITWDAGARLPREDVGALIREFAELEITVGGVLAGRDLRAAEPAPRSRGLAALLDPLVTRTRQSESQASAVIETHGLLAQHGLVALWNAWMAVRYRRLIPGPTFDLMVRPWVSVVGPLPEP